MTGAVLVGLAAAAFNVAVGRLAAGLKTGTATRYGVVQAAAFFCRAAVLFGAATVWWRRTGDAKGVVVLLLTGAVAQLVGQVKLHMRKEKTTL